MSKNLSIGSVFMYIFHLPHSCHNSSRFHLESNFMKSYSSWEWRCQGRTSRRLKISSHEVTNLRNNTEEHTGPTRKSHEPTRCSTLVSLFSPGVGVKSASLVEMIHNYIDLINHTQYYLQTTILRDRSIIYKHRGITVRENILVHSQPGRGTYTCLLHSTHRTL